MMKARDKATGKLTGGLLTNLLLAAALPAAALLTTGALLGCGPSFSMSTPPSFVTLDEEYSAYDYRATSADGLVIAAREVEQGDSKGSLTFWVKAIKNRMRDRGGYALLKELDVKSADGLSGKQLQFGHDEKGNHPHLYYLTVFVDPDYVYLVEAGGTKELMTAQAAEVEAAVRGFRRN
jgi:hypothetical protein